MPLDQGQQCQTGQVVAEGEKGPKQCGLIKLMCKQLAGDHFSIGYPEMLLSLACLFLIWCCKNMNGLPWNWPLLGMLPSLFCHVHRVHDRCVDLLGAVGGTFLLRGHWLADMDIVITADPANVHFVMSSNFANFPKGPEFKKIFDVLGDGIFNSDSEAWSAQRKHARFLISHHRFRKFLIRTTMEKIESGLVPVLDHFSSNGIVFDLQDLYQRLTFDTTCRLVTGFDPGCLSVELPDVPFSRAMDEAEEAIFMRHCLPETVWRLQRFLGIGHEKQMTRARGVLDRVINNYISMKRDELLKYGGDRGEEGIDLLTSYINGSEAEAEAGMDCNDDGFLRDTILNLMIAGRDTTSSALTWFTWLVARHPEVERRIREELDGVAGGGKWRLFGAEEVRSLVYLHCALLETLRLYPPVPFQHKAPVEPVVLPSGQCVNPSMKVMFSLYAMGRMEYIWGPDAGEFKPERWITERGTVRYEPSYKFLAFNAGPRTCLGKEIALTQLKSVAAAIIHNYEVEVVKGHPVAPNVSVILYIKHGFKVKVNRRWTS
ncbi:alkane hydroxylase MAH1-like [Salvia splendens]|uniref:alkane hydroxylase MAH1-like n=1 Tax=Salvia splendens TaxID=180675 RepID=UPI001C25BE8A|nr:alkane hydroxylase MAH1-like [Salvia splendens]